MPSTFSRMGGWRLLTLLSLAGFSAHAQQRPAPPHAQPGARNGRPLSEILTPDGRLRPGAQGSFDPAGYRMHRDPATGQPTFRTTGAGDEDWQGITGEGLGFGDVNALAVAANGDLYVGGSFSDAGGNPNADNIFRWDGTSLQTLGAGLNGGVSALMVLPNGDLLIGGQFNDAGGNPNADNIARWDGTTFQALGAGLNGGVSAMTTYGGSVYVVGQFYQADGTNNTNNVARWDGTSWQALGAGLNLGGYLASVAVRPNGEVYVGGYFNNVNGMSGANMIVYFDGSNWQRVGTGAGLDGSVQGLDVLPNGDIVAVGYFNSANSIPVNHVARWDGGSWHALGTGFSGGPYEVLAASNGDVYVAGFFTDNTNTVSAYTMRWDGTNWQTLNPDVDSYTYALAEAPNGDVWYGGSFRNAGSTPAPFHVARWNGTSWYAPAIIGLNNRVNAVAVSGSQVYVGGMFTNARGNADADYLIYWDGYGWQSLPGLNNQVRALAVAANGDLWVGGDFIDAGGNPAADNLARWDGSAWQSLGTGSINGGVNALAVAANGDLWIGGYFTNAGGNPNADNIARWNGTSFQALGSGLDSPATALAVAANGDLWVGGAFENAGGNPNADYVARWNGTSWQALGTGLDNQVAALAVAGTGQVWVGGFFQNAGGNAAADYVARWDGSSWQALGAGVNGPVQSLAAAGAGKVYAGGYFTDAGGNPTADHIALWTGSNWQALGTGLNDNVWALAAGTAGQLYAGGDFTTVGDGSKPLNYFGIHYAPSLIVSSPQLVPAGAYHNVTVTGTGIATLSGDITISGTLLVQENGILKFGNGSNCYIVTGPGEFYLESGSQLNICSPDGITYDAPLGNVQVTGYRYYDYARYIYDGTAAQVTGDAVDYYNIELGIANAAGVTLSQDVYVYDVLRLTSGTLNTAGHDLTLASYGDYTAYAVHAGGTTNGNVTVQRYIGGPSGLGYRHLSSPVQAAPVSDLATSGFTPIVNAAYNNLPYKAPKASQFPNVLGFNETRGGTTPAYAGFTTGYYSPTALNSILTPGRGWSVYMPGDISPDFVGALTTGNVPVALTVTGVNTSPNTLKAGWALMGNPYPQPIDWDLATVPAGMSASISVYRTSGGNNGQYLTRANGTGTLPDGVVPVGQGFFARATAPTTFTFTNALRVETNFGTVARPAAAAARPTLRLTLKATGTADAVTDETMVYVQAGATLADDMAFDGLRPGRNTGAVPTLATLIGGQEAAVNALPESVLTGTTETVVELTAVLPTPGTYALALAGLTGFGTTPVELLDRLTATRYNLTQQSAITLTATQADEAVTGRFALVINGRRGTSALAPLTSALTLYPNPATADGAVRLTGSAAHQLVTVLDLTGRRVATTQADAVGEAVLTTARLAAGTYVVRTADGRTTRLVIE